MDNIEATIRPHLQHNQLVSAEFLDAISGWVCPLCRVLVPMGVDLVHSLSLNRQRRRRPTPSLDEALAVLKDNPRVNRLARTGAEEVVAQNFAGLVQHFLENRAVQDLAALQMLVQHYTA